MSPTFDARASVGYETADPLLSSIYSDMLERGRQWELVTYMSAECGVVCCPERHSAKEGAKWCYQGQKWAAGGSRQRATRCRRGRSVATAVDPFLGSARPSFRAFTPPPSLITMWTPSRSAFPICCLSRPLFDVPPSLLFAATSSAPVRRVQAEERKGTALRTS